MPYTLGTLVPLAGGGYVAAFEKPDAPSGGANTDLLVQVYDTNRNAVGAALVIDQASTTTGAHLSVFDAVDLAANPFGGYAIAYEGAVAGNANFYEVNGESFGASGSITRLVNVNYSGARNTIQIIPLASGGFATVQGGIADLYDASGKVLMGIDDHNIMAPGDAIQIRDFITIIGTYFKTNGVTDFQPFGLDGAGGQLQVVIPVTGGAGQVISGTSGPNFITGGGSDTFIGGGYDVITSGGGKNQFDFAVNGGVAEVTNFNAATDTVSITDAHGGQLPVTSNALVTFDTRSHGLYWDDDGAAGPDKPVLLAVLDGVSQIIPADITGVSIAEVANVTLSGGYDAIGSGQITGSALADTLTGGAGNDTITGGAGNDRIDGGGGSNAAVFSGPKAAYGISLNADGSVVVSGPDGTDHLTNIQTLVFSDGSEGIPAPPVIVPVTGSPAPDLTTFIQQANLSAWVWDPTRGDVDLLTSDGHFYEYHLATQQLTLSMTIGGAPNAADITPDGKYLLVTNKAPPSTGGGLDQITRVDLAAFTTQTLQFSAGLGEGAKGIVVAANGQALVSTSGAGSGNTPLRQFDAEAASPSFVTIPTLQAADDISFAASGDRQNVLLVDNGDTSGAMFIYASAADAVIAKTTFASAVQSGMVDISSEAQLVADHIFQHTYLYDTALHPIAELTSVVPNAIGVAFSPGGHELFVLNSSGPASIVDTQSLTQVGSLTLPTTGLPAGATASGHMQVVDNGRVLLVDYGTAGVEAVDLSTRLTANLTIDARPGGDSVSGYAGNDSLLGASGNDSLTGGAGNDTIDGGGGVNTAFYSGAQANYSLTRNPDGSLTVTDLRTGSPDGTDRLTNVQALSFSDGTVATGASTAPPRSPPPDLTTFVRQNDMNAWAWDASRGMIDFVTNDGTVTGYSISAQQFTLSLTVGGSPSSVDVSVDGGYMLIGNAIPVVTSPPLAFTTTYANEVTRVNLNTDVVDVLKYTDLSQGYGVLSVAIAADGTALVATGNQFQPIRTFKVSDANPTFQTLLSDVYNANFLISPDHQKVLIEGISVTGGPLNVFSSGSDTVTATTSIFARYPTIGVGGIDAIGKLIVDELNGTTYVFDTSLNQVANLTSLTSGAIGATFTTGGHDLLVWQRSAQQILIFDTAHWTQVGTLSVPANTIAPIATSSGRMEVVDGGRLLLLDQGSGVQIIDLAARLTTSLSLTANPGGDSLLGYAGNDTLTTGSGNDTLDGGGGWNTAVFTGRQSDYITVKNTDGSITVGDIRAGHPDGTDQLLRVQSLKFSDGTVTLGPANAADAVNLGFSLLLREPVASTTDQAFHDSLESQAGAGGLTTAQAVADVIQHAAPTSSVATMAYQFFTGQAPSAAGMDFLVSPTGSNPNNLNSAYYQLFSTENRYINFAVNLGKLGAGAQAFSAAYGSLDLSAALTKAYTTIFGGPPSADKVTALLDGQVTSGGQTMTRAEYFALYGGDGPNGIGTKAAMVGWLLAEAVLADLGTYAKSNDAFLTDVAQHNAPFGVDIIGHYAQASFAYTGG